MSIHERLVEYANYYVGVHEATGHNDGVNVEEFQKAVDGKASGESWCMAFVQFCVKNVAGEQEPPAPISLFATEHCMTAWNKSTNSRSDEPKKGFIVIWNHEGTSNGHTGIITDVDGDTLYTIEGNTSDSSHVEANGDGVYLKKRNKYKTGNMKVVGFIDPFVGME